jgi:hypothetical protein
MMMQPILMIIMKIMMNTMKVMKTINKENIEEDVKRSWLGGRGPTFATFAGTFAL